jgi:hypothetical protein
MTAAETPRPVVAGAHHELARVLEAAPPVESIDHLDPRLSPSGRPETELVCHRTPRGTVPNTVAVKIAQSGLGIASLESSNHPDYLRVVVR